MSKGKLTASATQDFRKVGVQDIRYLRVICKPRMMTMLPHVMILSEHCRPTTALPELPEYTDRKFVEGRERLALLKLLY